MRADVRTVPTALRLSARTLRTIRMNLFWAFAYNAAAIPLAASGPAQPDDRRCGDGVFVTAGRDKQLAAQAV